MPKVVEAMGFRVVVWPNDHPPPHVHVFKAGTECLVGIGLPGRTDVSLWRNRGMADKDLQAALLVVQKHQWAAWHVWRKLHA